jgi:hypothetical protein
MEISLTLSDRLPSPAWVAAMVGQPAHPVLLKQATGSEHRQQGHHLFGAGRANGSGIRAKPMKATPRTKGAEPVMTAHLIKTGARMGAMP